MNTGYPIHKAVHALHYDVMPVTTRSERGLHDDTEVCKKRAKEESNINRRKLY